MGVIKSFHFLNAIPMITLVLVFPSLSFSWLQTFSAYSGVQVLIFHWLDMTIGVYHYVIFALHITRLHYATSISRQRPMSVIILFNV